jgi:hypothetical protein
MTSRKFKKAQDKYMSEMAVRFLTDKEGRWTVPSLEDWVKNAFREGYMAAIKIAGDLLK